MVSATNPHGRYSLFSRPGAATYIMRRKFVYAGVCTEMYLNVARHTAMSEVNFLFLNDVFISYECTRMDLNFHLAVSKQEMQSL